MARRVSTKNTPISEEVAPSAGDIFDVRKVRRLVELMDEYDLSEIDLKQGEQRVRLRRGPETVAINTSPSVALPAGSGSTSTSSPSSASPSPVVGSVDDSKFNFVRSPMVGTFYAASNPDAAPFVKIGDQVGPETTVCVIEAMKVFNEIPAECSGRIVATLVENGEPVEFGQPLFRVEPNS